MKVVGTIVEYNPLHNGHLYAIQEIKRNSKADVLIAVMSGEFSMRGDLCLYDKFTKTKQALQAGIDCIIELPFLFTVQHADIFAEEAVRLLSLAGVTEIWCGSEKNDITCYQQARKTWLQKETQQQIQAKLKTGMSYKMATASVLSLEANDMLGFAYYQAIQNQKLPITLHTIQRMGSGYHDVTVQQFASAKAIRNNLSLMKDYCPSYVCTDSMRSKEALFPYLKYEILHHSISELKQIFLVEEGLEHAIKKIQYYSTLKDFTEALCSKRYTQSRIQRMLVYVLLHLSKETLTSLRELPRNYIRVLGYSDIGLVHLKNIKKRTTIYTNIKEGLHPVLDYDLLVSKVLDIIFSSNLLTLEQKGPIR